MRRGLQCHYVLGCPLGHILVTGCPGSFQHPGLHHILLLVLGFGEYFWMVPTTVPYWLSLPFPLAEFRPLRLCHFPIWPTVPSFCSGVISPCHGRSCRSRSHMLIPGLKDKASPLNGQSVEWLICRMCFFSLIFIFSSYEHVKECLIYLHQLAVVVAGS